MQQLTQKPEHLIYWFISLAEPFFWEQKMRRTVSMHLIVRFCALWLAAVADTALLHSERCHVLYANFRTSQVQILVDPLTWAS